MEMSFAPILCCIQTKEYTMVETVYSPARQAGILKNKDLIEQMNKSYAGWIEPSGFFRVSKKTLQALCHKGFRKCSGVFWGSFPLFMTPTAHYPLVQKIRKPCFSRLPDSVGLVGLEPMTPTMSTWCSNQLSYNPMRRTFGSIAQYSSKCKP